jgi:hypothetical protein
MTSRVVSTKLTEEEYGKLVGLCSKSGYTVSKLLKRAILERMNEELPKIEKPKEFQITRTLVPKIREDAPRHEDRFLYY